MQEIYTYIQSFGASLTFVTSLIISYIVLKKHRDTLNYLFASGVFFLGLSMFFVILSNMDAILYGINGPLVYLQLSYTSLVISLLLLNLAMLYINYGDRIFKNSILVIYLLISVLISGYILWFTEPFTHVALADVNSTSLFKVVIYGTLIISYLFTLVITLYVYRTLDGQIKSNMRLFLIGWLFGGVALIINALGDIVREFDILSQVVLTIAIILIFLSFNRQTESVT